MHNFGYFYRPSFSRIVLNLKTDYRLSLKRRIVKQTGTWHIIIHVFNLLMI